MLNQLINILRFLVFLSFHIFYFSPIFYGNLKAELTYQSQLGSNQKWFDQKLSEKENLKNLIFHLSKSKHGQKLLKEAEIKSFENNSSLIDNLKVGNGSLTDTSLIRRFGANNPFEVEYIVQTTIYINRDLDPYSAILDLSHELVHYIYRPTFNPYQNPINKKDFIISTLEGQGGEVQAFINECMVLSELFPRSIHKKYNCHLVTDQSTGIINADLAKKLFYQVGPYFQQFTDHLNDYHSEHHKHQGHENIHAEFPHLSNDRVVFVSSAWSLPYPLSAQREYEEIMSKVCQNDLKRLSYIQATYQKSDSDLPSKNQPSPERSIASLGTKAQFWVEDFQKRCSSFL